MNTTRCSVDSIVKLNDYVYQVKLTPASTVEYRPGQYAKLVLSEDDKRIFSIASHPSAEQIELHIGAAEGDEYPLQAIAHLQANPQVIMEIGEGDAFLREQQQRPRLLIAGGTGFSYVHSILTHMLEHGNNPPTEVIWGCRSEVDMYYFEQVKAWADANDWLSFTPVLENAVENTQATQGLLLDVVKALHPNLAEYDVYLAGRFEMAAAAKAQFVEQQVDLKHLYGDAFGYV
ncbi:NAD(P)H-flavin reductase [Paraferrimonas sedimenticola]|uniref:NAD(P)H-flavin reductase n=1 Tax=Paraferrimonas sedimenticola TaxID=375674 RepID=A0AA37W1I9_9GAMM|nr:NAD(P)H-flavin reductase [Paraferrimonas sedimenticola]GLP97450.1 NAD(P)H-flavin reductase [Paraferrimonas sedimenticola]